MKVSRSVGGLVLVLVGFCSAVAAKAAAADEPDSMTQDFLQQIATNHYAVNLGNDNQDAALPVNFRAWWFVKLQGVDPAKETKIQLGNRGHRFYYRPVYSYDGHNWQLFSQAEITQFGNNDLLLKKTFAQSAVYVARAEPYPYQRLKAYVAEVAGSNFVKVSNLAQTQRGYPIPMLTITDFSVPAAQKTRIWVHARTHPGEVAASFVVEGLIAGILNPTAAAQPLKKLIFSIVPMHNIDGVIAGNNRTTPRSENLEELWHYDPQAPAKIAADSPRENRILAHTIAKYESGPAPISIMLNLHSTNGHPHFFPHFVPHFGNTPKFKPEERSLFSQQKALADIWHRVMKFGRSSGAVASNPLFLKKSYPETWFWRQFRDKVLAMTFESTYGKIPGGQRYFTAADHRALGQGLAQAVFQYQAARETSGASMGAGAH